MHPPPDLQIDTMKFYSEVERIYNELRELGYCNDAALDVEALTASIVGLPARESSALLGFLFDHCARPEFVYRHVWRDNDLIVIDNRCTNHCAVADYDMDEVREMLIVCVREN